MTLLRLRLAAALLAGLPTLVGTLLLAPAPPPARAAEPVSSAVTVAGTGEFSDLRVTIAQTKDLLNQVVPVTWTGGKPTSPSAGSFAQDYLQIMQCWGDGPDGPDREQCQYGGLRGDSRGGAFVATRQVSYGSQLVDPKETYKPDMSGASVDVPFQPQPAPDRRVDGRSTEFFDSYSTNEIPFGRTHADGAGQEFFEVQTAKEAYGLGCGEALPAPGGGQVGRSCWLVVVPRGETEVDGTTHTGSSDPLISSPLSASNWEHRLVVPLSFQPIGVSCPIGGAERPTKGQEVVAEAIGRYQPALCGATGSVFGYSQLPDSLARRKLASPTPELVYVSRPLPADQVLATQPPVYAPVAVSGITLAFDVESQSNSSTPAEVRQRDGERIPEINLTPRLVAKLLTQSYRLGASVQEQALKNNPTDMTKDKDFLDVNPTFAKLAFPSGISDVLEPLSPSDATYQLWRWVAGDPDARKFLTGDPDPWGMTVNPGYAGIQLPREDFPKADGFCAKSADPGTPDTCALDAHPYAQDMLDAARAASRGDKLSRAYDKTAVPPGFKKVAPQPSGSRAVMAFTDTALASRFSLTTARLRNAAGNFVAPTPAALLAAVGAAGAAAAPGAEPGVLDVDPATPAADAYPLTALSYAATAPAALDADAGKAYASLLRYIATDGQHSGVANGQLPPGYAPLPEALRSQTLAAAARIEQDAGKPAASPSAALAASSGNRATAPGSAGVNGVQALIVVEPGAAGAGGSPAGGSVAGGSVAPTPASGGGSSRPRPGGITPTGRSTRDSPAAGPAPSRAAVATGAPAAAGAPSTPIRSPAPVPAPAVAPVPGATEPGGLATLTAAPRTAGEAVGFARYALLLALVVGALAAAAAPVLLRAARGSGGDATPG